MADICTLVVKVTDDNAPSIRLFESIGFAVHKHLAVIESLRETSVVLGTDSAAAFIKAVWAEFPQLEGSSGPMGIDGPAQTEAKWAPDTGPDTHDANGTAPTGGAGFGDVVDGLD